MYALTNMTQQLAEERRSAYMTSARSRRFRRATPVAVDDVPGTATPAPRRRHTLGRRRVSISVA